MKVLLDENVSRGLALWLTDRGFTAFVVGKDLESGFTDQDVFGFAVSKRAILITRDNDFTNPVRFRVERRQASSTFTRKICRAPRKSSLWRASLIGTV